MAKNKALPVHKALAGIFKACAGFASDDETRYNLAFVRVTHLSGRVHASSPDPDGGVVRFEATDGHKLVRIDVDRAAFLDAVPAPGFYDGAKSAKTTALGASPVVGDMHGATFPDVTPVFNCSINADSSADMLAANPAYLALCAKTHADLYKALTGADDAAILMTSHGEHSPVVMRSPTFPDVTPVYTRENATAKFACTTLCMPMRLPVVTGKARKVSAR